MYVSSLGNYFPENEQGRELTELIVSWWCKLVEYIFPWLLNMFSENQIH